MGCNVKNAITFVRDKGRIKRKIFNEKTNPYILIAPAVIFILTIVVYPVLRTIYYSFFDFKLWKMNNITFVGMDNYLSLLKDPDYILAFINTFKWVIIVVSLQFAFGMLIALLLSQHFMLRGFVRAVILIPWVTPSVVTALMWVWMYHGNFGIINYLLNLVGIIDDFVPFLAQTTTALYACMVTVIWQGTPFFVIMLIAGLSGIPAELYEASNVDGASSMQKFIHITLPCLRNTIFITTLLRIIWVANNVDIIYLMTGGGPANSSLTIPVDAYITAQKGYDFGYASSMSVTLAIILSIMAIFYVKKMKSTDGVK